MASFQPANFVRNVLENSERPLIGGPAPEGTIALSSGDPDFRTPEHIREAMIEAVRQGYSNYPPGNGDPELLDALSGLLGHRYGVTWSSDDITITNGGGGALFASMGAYLNPGDKVLVPQPTFSSYRDIAMLHGAEVVWVSLTDDWHLDLDTLREAARTSDAKMLILCNPNNPTGVVYNREELEGAAQIAQEFNLLVLADEVYDHLILDDIPYVSTMEIEGFRDRLAHGLGCRQSRPAPGRVTRRPQHRRRCQLGDAASRHRRDHRPDGRDRGDARRVRRPARPDR
jgi:aspartate aminotransferase